MCCLLGLDSKVKHVIDITDHLLHSLCYLDRTLAGSDHEKQPITYSMAVGSERLQNQNSTLPSRRRKMELIRKRP